MKHLHLKTAGGVAVVGAIAVAAWAAAPEQKGGKSLSTPPNWSYDIRNGQRVPRVPRTTNPDGSWTEQIKQGPCTITRTGRDGEVREVRKCD
jgi:hypothetical protein